MSSEQNYNPTERCVAVLDILGFRSQLANGGIVDLATQLDTLYQHATSATVHWAYSSSQSDERSQSGKERVNRLLFSDSLFLWSQPLPKTAVRRRIRINSFASLVTNILGSALARGLPMRAGLAFGEVVIDLRKQIVIGQPIVDAYHVESMQDWAGGAFHSSYPMSFVSAAKGYDIPTKEGIADPPVFAVDWVTQFYAGTRKEANEIISRIRVFLKAQIEQSDHASVRQKYANTLDFLESRHKLCEEGFIVDP